MKMWASLLRNFNRRSTLCAAAQDNAGKRGPRTLTGKTCVGQVLLPVCELGTQAREIELRERLLGARQIAKTSVKDGSSTNKVFARLMMKSDRQLNQPLEVLAPGASTRRGPPNVLQHFVGVVEVSMVKELDTMGQTTTIGDRFLHCEMANKPCLFRNIQLSI